MKSAFGAQAFARAVQDRQPGNQTVSTDTVPAPFREETSMNRILKQSLAAALFLAAGLSATFAHGFTVGDLKIGHPWSKPTIAGAKVAGGYLKITNEGKQDDRLLSVSIAPERAKVVQLHEMKMENDVMKMREIEGGIAVPAGQVVELKPGGLHIMFMDIPAPFVDGEKVKATLTFEKAGAVEVEFAVHPPKEADAKKEGHSEHKMQ